ncbi:hypothetical protein B0H13DRAFT_1591423 [Mycena leptocephala]|nr:hypothetical protein B0H13DRAFT_1591423 [Mycena leptocephala]
MAALARDYHDNLQTEGLTDPDTRQEASERTFENVSARLSNTHKSEMAKNLTRDEVEHVIDILPNGKAPGINGLPYELWKKLNWKFPKGNSLWHAARASCVLNSSCLCTSSATSHRVPQYGQS